MCLIFLCNPIISFNYKRYSFNYTLNLLHIPGILQNNISAAFLILSIQDTHTKYL